MKGLRGGCSMARVQCAQHPVLQALRFAQVRERSSRHDVQYGIKMSQEASPEPRSRRTGQAWLLILVGVVAGVAGERLIVPTNSKTEVARAATATEAPLLRVGDRMVVPESSLLRSLLLVEPASVKDVARELVV